MLLNIKLRSRNNTDAGDVLHSSVKSVTMETTRGMLGGPSCNYVNTNSEGTIHLQSLTIKYSCNLCACKRGLGCVDSYELHHSRWKQTLLFLEGKGGYFHALRLYA